MTVWQLVERPGYSDYVADYTYAIFSSPDVAVVWLRKSRKFMGDPSGPIIPMEEGRCIMLNERFMLVPFEVDPLSIAAYDDSPVAAAG